MRQLVEIAMFTREVSAMASFYRELLGTEPVAESDDMAIFLSGGTKIFIHKSYALEGDELPPENHFAFAVADVDAVCQSLKDRGAQVAFEPRDYYWGRSAYLRDPDGHLVELTQAGE